MASLEQIWDEARSIAGTYSEKGALPPVMGGGRLEDPRFALVFINPTARNASTRDGWTGERWPWIGTTAVWKVLAEGGLLPHELHDEIRRTTSWDAQFARHVYSVVAENGCYITNLVKWTGPNGDLPSPKMVSDFAGLTRRELELVRPRHIVAFGGITFKALTGRDVLLRTVLESVREGLGVPVWQMLGSRLGVSPCYFPVGRGNPKGAAEILRTLRDTAVL